MPFLAHLGNVRDTHDCCWECAGGRLVVQYTRKKPSYPVCPISGQRLHGVRHNAEREGGRAWPGLREDVRNMMGLKMGEQQVPLPVAFSLQP